MAATTSTAIRVDHRTPTHPHPDVASAATPPRERPGGPWARKPPRIERWRWFIAGAVAVAAWAAEAGSVVALWVVFTSVIAVHEAGHALAARVTGVPYTKVVLGVGPLIARTHRWVRPVELRAIPILGYVALDRDDVAPAPQRLAAVAAAGPLASLALGTALLIGATALTFGPANLERGDAATAVRVTGRSVVDVWSVVYRPVGDLVAGDATPVTPTSRTVMDEVGTEPELVSIIGVVADDTSRGRDLRWFVLFASAVSAGIGALNLLPAWGFDGHQILVQTAEAVRRRHGDRGRWAATTVGALTTLTTILGAWALGATVLRDIVALW